MFKSENAGVISKSPHEENIFWWKTPNCFAYEFSNHDQMDPRIVSSRLFSVFNNKWRLVLVPNANAHQAQYIGLFLWMTPSSNETPKIEVKLILVNDDDVEYKSCAGDVDLNGCFGSWQFLSSAHFSYEKNSISPAGILKFVCVMKERVPIIFGIPRTSCFTNVCDKNESKVTDAEINKGKQDGELESKGVDRLIKNLEDLLLNEWGSDVLLKNSDHEFRAHMAILVARSPVFASMFQHDMIEKKTGEVDISDCSTAGFKVFLQFLYSGNADMSSVNVLDLYYIADKYQVDDLKLDCVEIMKDTLTLDNFCDVISLSLRHNESDLQESATQFFCSNIRGIVKTVQWQRYLAENPTHANELIIKAVNA